MLDKYVLAKVKIAAKIGKINVGSAFPKFNHKKCPCFNSGTREIDCHNAIKIGICTNKGRQPAYGLTPFSAYKRCCSSLNLLCVSGSLELYCCCSAFNFGCNSCVLRMLFVWKCINGNRITRMISVNKMIPIPALPNDNALIASAK